MMATSLLLSSASAFRPMSRTATRAVASVSMSAPLKDGDKVPSVTFKCRVRDEKIGGSNPFTWKDVASEALFKGKRAVVFSLPGAFTPTCSSTHLPGYVPVLSFPVAFASQGYPLEPADVLEHSFFLERTLF